jgi:hypothetical protein
MSDTKGKFLPALLLLFVASGGAALIYRRARGGTGKRGGMG